MKIWDVARILQILQILIVVHIYFRIVKLPDSRRSVYWFRVISCLAYIVIKLATISHDL